jgi:class 3 adenylate cyclase
VTIHTYLSQDRLRALARGETLPDRAHGSALFADISGFTALTEGLRESLGARRGAEELTKTLGAVYSALISQIEKFGGSVIAFAGDAALCWFDDTHGNAAPRAAACAFALQEVMRDFSTISLPGGKTTALTLKVTIATGHVRRFVVGDPEVRRLDTLAGATVTRTSTAEHLAGKGEVIIDEATAQALGETLTIQEWRTDADSDERFAVLSSNGRQQFMDSESLTPILPTSLRPPAASKLRVWLHNSVYEREQFGEGSFLTEFRPCVMLFVKFTGIDYDSASAESELDAFIRQVQTIATLHDGTLMDINIGDKGSYAYVNFGALSTHEDDPRRAVKTALELQNSSSLSLQMGITQGLMRVGAYGGLTRRAYGALGDDVNLAARLMTAASTGEILLSGSVHKMVRSHFTFEPHPPLSDEG